MAYSIFFNQEDYSDITVKFSGREIHCHKMIICMHSEYFKKLCGPGSQFAERNYKVIELKDDDPEAVEAIIRQIYFGDYNSGGTRTLDWSFHAAVAMTARKVCVCGSCSLLILLTDIRLTVPHLKSTK